MADGHDLGGGTSTADTNAHVEFLELVSTQEKDGLVNLEAHGGGFKELDWLSVDFDEALATGDVGDSCCVFLSAEGLNLFCFSHLSFLDLCSFLLDQAK